MPGHLRFRRSGRSRWRVRRWPFIPPHLAARLTAWGQLYFRPYPWRRTEDPFHLLLAEMLLRRTHATHASRLWERLITAYPTARALAGAPIPELERLLRPAGMAHRRALSLRQMARYLVEHWNGQVPAAPADLMAVPHVGRYAAHAVASFGFGLPFAVADVNVMRVLGRFVGSGESVHYKIPGHIWRRAGRSAPFANVSAFNYALLDLAALVCKPGRPNCGDCPLQTGCVGGRSRV
jgi:A/G-specific adenine glycosylase